MGDAEGSLPSSKKRQAGREISRDDPGLDDDEQPEPEMGTFKRASDEVLATRRIVKVRRNTSQAPAASANPFAGLQLVAETQSTATLEAAAHTQDTPDKQDIQQGTSEEDDRTAENCAAENGRTRDEAKDEVPNNEQLNEKPDNLTHDKEVTGQQSEKSMLESHDNEEVEKKVEDFTVEGMDQSKEGDRKKNEETGDTSIMMEKHIEGEEIKQNEGSKSEKKEDIPESTSPFSSFQQLSSRQNAFTGLAGMSFSSAFPGLAGTGTSASSFSFGVPSSEGFTFATSSALQSGQSVENNSLFGTSQIFGSTAGPELRNKPTMQEVPVETGEENEKVIFKADAVLFEYLDGGWKERGKGEVKLNVMTSGSEKARLVMRARGNYRLILNASLYPDMALKSMEKRGVTFACVNSASEAKDGLTTFALKFKEASILDEFRGVVETHKAKRDTTELKTPENSPKASDD